MEVMQRRDGRKSLTTSGSSGRSRPRAMRMSTPNPCVRLDGMRARDTAARSSCDTRLGWASLTAVAGRATKSGIGACFGTHGGASCGCRLACVPTTKRLPRPKRAGRTHGTVCGAAANTRPGV